MAKQREGDGIKGLPLPDPVDPGVFTEFRICIPSAWQYRSALVGAIAELCKYWNWEHTEDDKEAAENAAFLFKSALTDSSYEEACMTFCERLIDCLTSDEDVAQAIAQLIRSNSDVISAVQQISGQSAQPGSTSTPGQRMPNTNWFEFIEPPDDCDLNALWAQCEQFVDYVVTAGTDTLEILETYSNNVEAAQFIEMAPFIGTLFDEAQLDQVIAFIDWGLEVIAEVYAAADTDPHRKEIACAIFCRCRPDCGVSLDKAWAAINERTGGIFEGSALNSTSNLIDAAVEIATSPEFPLEIWMMIVIGLGRTMGFLGTQAVNTTLNLVLKLAVNDANNDWILLCDDCAPVVEWRPTLINGAQPPDTNPGTVVDNGDGLAIFTAGFSYGAYRVQFKLHNESLNALQCFVINSLEYGPLEFPNNLQCDDILRDGPPIVDGEYGGIIGADLNPFTITVNYTLT